MYEQDVKLARMLIDKIKAIKGEESTVKTGLDEARSELNRVQQIREERDAYLSILSEAADLLDSKDLVIENPDTTEQQEMVDNLEYKLEELDEEAQKYNRLMKALREKAPQLFGDANENDPEAAPELSEEALEVAGEEASASLVEEVTDADAPVDEPEEEAEPEEAEAEDGDIPTEILADADVAEELEESAEDEDDAADEEEEDAPATLEVHVGKSEPASDEPGANGNGAHEAVAEDAGSGKGQPLAASETQPAPGPAEDSATAVIKVAVESPERTLSRFNLDHLKKKEAFTFGRGAAYIVDGDSVLDRLPYYDYSLRGVLEAQTRDELARDIDVLSTELHGKFHIVFSSKYSSSIKLGEHVSLDCADGQGGKEAGDEHVRSLVSDLIAKHTCVCVITGDVALADSVRGQSIHILQLHDFFRA